MVANYDGPTLRAIRQSMGIPLRRIARLAGMSHGHLSKVERGEPGRPITPAVISAYERTTGVSLAEAVAAMAEHHDGVTGRRGQEWRPGQLIELQRVTFNAALASIAIGGQLDLPLTKLLDSTGRPIITDSPDPSDIAQLEQLGDLLAALDLQFGGAMTSQLAKHTLRWALTALEPPRGFEPSRRRLHGTLGVIASRAAWAAFDTGGHEAARTLFRLALFCAVRAGDTDLRAHVMAEAAAQHNQLGYHDDALNVIRAVEGDERVAPAVQVVIHAVKARAYARTGAVDACRRQLALAERAYTASDPAAPGWLGRLHHPGRLHAMTGHALADLAQANSSRADLREAQQRLTAAIEALDPHSQVRPRALCTTRLAATYGDQGDLDQLAHWGWEAVRCARGVHSARLNRGLRELRTLAVGHPDKSGLRELTVEIDSVRGSEDGADDAA